MKKTLFVSALVLSLVPPAYTQTVRKTVAPRTAPAARGVDATMLSLVNMIRSSAPRGRLAEKNGAVTVENYYWTNVKATGCVLDYTKTYEQTRERAPIYHQYQVNHMRLNLSQAIPLSEPPKSSLDPSNFKWPENVLSNNSIATYSFDLRFSADQPRNGYLVTRDLDESVENKSDQTAIRDTYIVTQTLDQANRIQQSLNRAIDACQNRPVPTSTVAVTAPPEPQLPAITESVWVTSPEGPNFFGLHVGMDKDALTALQSKIKAAGLNVDPTYGPYIIARSLPEEVSQGYHGIPGWSLLDAKLYFFGPDEARARFWSLDVNLWKAPEDGEERTNEENAANVIMAFRAQTQKLSGLYTVKRESQEIAQWPFDCTNGSQVAQARVAELKRVQNMGIDITDPSISRSYMNGRPVLARGYLGRNEIQILAQHCGVVPKWETDYEVSPRVQLQVYIDNTRLGGQGGTIMESLSDMRTADAVSVRWAKQKKKLNK